MLVVAPAASGALAGPVYPVPGGPGSGDGGNTCVAATDLDGAMGKGPGQTWSYGGGNGTPPVGCPYDETPPAPTPFDTTRFKRLYWGISSAPELALDGVVDAPGETLTLDPATDLANGKVVWTGTTTMKWCPPSSCASFTTSAVSTRFTLIVKDQAGSPTALTDPAAAGIPSPAGIGGVIAVTPAVNRFSATLLFEADDPETTPVVFSPALDMFNAKNHPDPPEPPATTNTTMGVGGGFWVESLDPVVPFVPTPAPGPAPTLTVAVDTAKPVASLTVAKQKLGKVLSKGLKGTLKVNEAASAAVQLSLPKGLAKKLKLKGAIGAVTVRSAAAGSTPFTVKVKGSAKGKLSSLGSVPLILAGTVTDKAGNSSTVKKSVTVKK